MKYLSIKKKDYATEIHEYKKPPLGINFEISITTLYVGLIFCALVIISPPWTILIFSPLILIAFIIVFFQIVFFGGWALIKLITRFFSGREEVDPKENKKSKHVEWPFFFLTCILAGLFMREVVLFGYFDMLGRAQMDYLIYKDMKNNNEKEQTMFLGDMKWSSWYWTSYDASFRIGRTEDIFVKKGNYVYRQNKKAGADILSYEELSLSLYYEYSTTYKSIQKIEIENFISSLYAKEIKINDFTIQINENKIDSTKERGLYKNMDFGKIEEKISVLIDMNAPTSGPFSYNTKLVYLNRLFPNLRRGDEIIINSQAGKPCTFGEDYKTTEQWETDGIKTIVNTWKGC